MSEPTQEQYKEISKVFIKKYNRDFNEKFILKDICDEKSSEDYDLLYCDGEQDLKVQHVEAVPCRGKHLANLKINKECSIILQEDYWRIRESIGHKGGKYSTEDSLVLLIDFDLFSWDNENLDLMSKVAREMKNKFRNIYCIHTGKKMCKKLS